MKAWPEVALGELAIKLQDGPFGSNLKSSHYVPDGIRVVRLQNIGVGRFDDTDKAFISEEHFARLKKHECQPGDVLIATLGDPIIRACIQPASLPTALNKADCLQLRCDRKRVLPNYLSSYLNSDAGQRRVGLLAHGQTRLRINLGQLRGLRVPLPPIEDQRRIVAVLDQADLVRRKREASRELLESIRGSIFLEMFGEPVANPKGWPVGSIRDLLVSATYGTSRKASADGELPVLRMGNITSAGSIDLTELKRIDLPYEEREKHTVRFGDVLFNRTNSRELVGKSAVVSFDAPMAFAGYLIRLRCARLGSSEFLGAFLNLPSTKRRLRAMCKAIIGMANINAREVQAISIPIPPDVLQARFGEAVQAASVPAGSMSRHLGELDSLLTSLQHRAFSGAL